MTLRELFNNSIQNGIGLLKSILQDKIISECNVEGSFLIDADNWTHQKFMIRFLKLNISDCWFGLVSKKMSPTWVVREVFKNSRFKALLIAISEIHCFSYCQQIIVIECEIPYIIVVISSFSQNRNDRMIKFLIFEHPQNGNRIEYITIKNVFSM